MIRGGRGLVRRVMFMATLTAIRRHPPHLYERLRTTGHPGKLALTAARRKLLTMLNAILRDHRPWLPA